MKKINQPVAMTLLTASLFSAGCTMGAEKEITAEEIVAAYENAGFTVREGWRGDKLTYEYYGIEVTLGEGEDQEFIYFHVYDTKEEAEAETEESKWNVVLWIFCLPFGEYRWLKSKTYSNVHYEYFDRDMVEPFKALID